MPTRTLSALIERVLRLVFAEQRSGSTRARVELPVSSATGGTLAGIDLNDSASLLDVLERRH